MRFEGELAAGSRYLSSRPVELALEVTTECAMRCIHCFRQSSAGQHENTGHMNPALLDSLEPFMDTALRIIIVGNGEPLAHPCINEILDKCLNSGAEVSFSTNGDLLTADLTALIVENGLARINFSVDSASPKRYEKIRKGSRLLQVVLNIEGLAEKRKEADVENPLIVVASTLMRQNISEAQEIVRLAANCGADRVLFQPLDIPGANFQAREFFLRESLPLHTLKKTIEAAQTLGSSLGIVVESPTVDSFIDLGSGGERAWDNRTKHPSTDVFKAPLIQAPYPMLSIADSSIVTDTMNATDAGSILRAAERPGKEITDKWCTRPWTSFFVHWNGDVSLCRARTYGNAGRLLPYSDPEKIWNGPAFRKIRAALSGGYALEHCRDCMEDITSPGVVEELSRVVLPMESVTEPAREADNIQGEDPDSIVLGLGFSGKGASFSFFGGGIPFFHCLAADMTGIAPSRFISRLSPPSLPGEFFIEDGYLIELAKKAAVAAGIDSLEKVRIIAYNQWDTISAGLPGGRNPALEELFPSATPLVVPPNLAQMAIAFFTTTFKESALIATGGPAGSLAGERGPVITLARAAANRIESFKRISTPHDPSTLVKAAMNYLALEPGDNARFAEIASRGSNQLLESFLDEVELVTNGGVRFAAGGFLSDLCVKSVGDEESGIHTDVLENNFGPRRQKGREVESRHMDVAFAVQRVFSDILIHLALQAQKKTGSVNLCLAGCAGLNETSMMRLLKETPFEAVHMAPVLVDDGLGAGGSLYTGVIRLNRSRPDAKALSDTLTAKSTALPTDDDRARYEIAALSTCREQHQRLARLWRDEKKSAVPPNAAVAMNLLARQNERLLSFRREKHNDIVRLCSDIEALLEERAFLKKFKSVRYLLKARSTGKSLFGKTGKRRGNP